MANFAFKATFGKIRKLWTKLSLQWKAIILAIPTIASGIFTVNTWFHAAIRAEVRHFFAPIDKMDEAERVYASDQDDAAFKAVEDAIKLYKERDGENSEYQIQALRRYIWMLCTSKTPDRNVARLELALERLKQAGESQSPIDINNLAWFYLGLGDHEKAEVSFSKCQKAAVISGNTPLRGNAIEGRCLCEIAKGDASTALKRFKEAQTVDPNSLRREIFFMKNPDLDPYYRLYCVNYDKFRNTMDVVRRSIEPLPFYDYDVVGPENPPPAKPTISDTPEGDQADATYNDKNASGIQK